jgi:hypothetical protein
LQKPLSLHVVALRFTFYYHSIWIKRLERDFLTGDKEVTTSARTNRRAVVERKLMEYEEMKRNQSPPYNP